MDTLVLAFVGDDAPGLVHALAEVLSDHGGNWRRSEMTTLSGVFAGILEVTVEPQRAEALIEDFRALDGMLDVTVSRPSEVARDAEPGRAVVVDAVGRDRCGIVEPLAAAVARAGASLDRLTTTCLEDRHGRRFVAHAEFRESGDVDLDELTTRLREIGESLEVEVRVRDGGTGDA